MNNMINATLLDVYSKYHERNVHEMPSFWPQEIQADCGCNRHQQDNNEDDSMNPVNIQLEIHDEVKQQQQLNTKQTGTLYTLADIH